MIPLRLYIYAAIALAFAGLIARDHFQTRKLNRVTAERNQAQANLTAERENTRKANEAEKRHQARADLLEADKRNTPLPAVRVCRSTPRVPTTGTAAVTDEAVEAHNPPADEGDRDIGPALDDFATD